MRQREPIIRWPEFSGHLHTEEWVAVVDLEASWL